MDPNSGKIRELTDDEKARVLEAGDRLADGYVVVGERVKRMHDELDELRVQRRQWRKAEKLRR